MRRLGIALLVLGLVGLTVSSIASAHPNSWYWGRHKAQDYVYDRYTINESHDIARVQCRGLGRFWRPNRYSPQVLHHHFRCAAIDDVDRIWYFTLHPVSRNRAVLTEIKCDDTNAVVTCQEE
jgi:hypothetical protein